MKGRKARKERGFSLIELLIVVAIILIIAAIAVPNLLKAKGSANAASAVGSLRTIHSADQLFDNTYGYYAPTFAAMCPPASGTAPSSTAADLLDNVICGASPTSTTTPVKAGYQFTYTPAATDTTNQAWAVQADPVSGAPAGSLHYCIDTSGVIRSNAAAITVGTAPAVACDSTKLPL